MSARAEKSLICFAIIVVGIVLTVAMAYGCTLIRVYAPGVRDYLLWLVYAPQFGIGMLFGMMLLVLLALLLAWKRP